jgi:HEPN domain-containing protein
MKLRRQGKYYMKKQVEVWIKFAEKDLLTVCEVIERPELTNVVAFHCHQAIEKYFKAFVLENEKPLAKIHNLLTLYGTIKEITDFGFDEDLLATINDVYLESRYPGEVGLLDDGSMPTIEQANKFFIFAKEIEKKIKDKLEPPV